MKKKITLQLPSDLLDRLKAEADERGVNRAIVVEKALARFLLEPADASAADNLPQRLEDQLQSIQNELKSVAETVALHARYQLAWTSQIRDPASEGRSGAQFEAARGAECTPTHVLSSIVFKAPIGEGYRTRRPAHRYPLIPSACR
jgi:hypothetical protein